MEKDELKDCLAASLTILIKLRIIDREEVSSSMQQDGGLYELLNDTYKKLTEDED
ncbi:hypothetical protein [Halalkalibacter oceani]|uniref:hypothetical protein n=1 Tax=Halalkalibacter oceani TaxID=1653776 RepID=UPI00339AAB87